MEANLIANLLNIILEHSNSEPEILELINITSCQNQTQSQNTISLIKLKLEDFSGSPFSKLQCIRLLKSLMSLKKPSIILLTENEITQSLENYIISKSQQDGFQTWVSLLESPNKFEFKTYILSLQCLETWTKLYPKDKSGRDSKFKIALKKLKDRNTEFPPSFFLKSSEDLDQKIPKRDIRRVKNLTKEFIKNLSYTNKQSCFLLKKVLRSYEKTLKEPAKKDLNGKVLFSLLEEIREIFKIYSLWKTNNFGDLPKETGNIRIVKLVQDPYPKLSIRCDENYDELCVQEATEPSKQFEHKKCSSKCLSNYMKIERYKEKIFVLKELLSNLQNQVGVLKEQNSALAEEKDCLFKSIKNTEKIYVKIEKKYIDIKQKFEDLQTAINRKGKQLRAKSIQEETRNSLRTHENNSLSSFQTELNTYQDLPINTSIENYRNRYSCSSGRVLESQSCYKKNIIEKYKSAELKSRTPSVKRIETKDASDMALCDSESESLILNESPKILPTNNLVSKARISSYQVKSLKIINRKKPK